MDRQTLASSSNGDPPPQEDSWLTTYNKLLPHWQYQQSAIPISISRVNQVDAARLDIEMSGMLKEQLVKVLLFDEEVFARGAWLLIQRMEGIYKAASFSNLLLFFYTGRYRNLIERALRARLVYGSPNMNRAVSFEYMNHQLVWNEFSVIFHPLAECCRFYMAIWGILMKIYLRIYVCNFAINHLLGKRSLTLSEKGRVPERTFVCFCFTCCQTADRSCFPTCVSLLFLEELLLLLLPLLNSSSVKKFLRPFSKDRSSDSSVDDTLCPICQGKPTISFLAIPCQHSYCYYCLQTRCSAAPSFRCPRCGELIAAMQRHGGSVNKISQIQ